MNANDNGVCWSCSQTAGGEPLCAHCGALQPPPRDYFAILGVTPRLDLDLTDLQKRFYDLSRRLHPDVQQRKSAREKQYSLEASAVLNDAWRTLGDPVSRAEYVLRQNGFEIGDTRSRDVPAEWLEEVFEMNMAIEELDGGDAAARGQLELAGKRFAALREETDRELAEQFRRWDSTGNRETLEEIRGLLNRRRYIRNLVRDVEKALAG